MRRKRLLRQAAVCAAVLVVAGGAMAREGGLGVPAEVLEGTAPLTLEGDLAELMIAGADRFLLKELEASVAGRAERWRRDPSSAAAWEASVEPNRARLARIVGLRDARPPFDDLELVATTAHPALVARTADYEVLAVRWPALEGVYGEGLLAQPNGRPPVADVVVVPDCEQSPEALFGLVPGVPPECQFARRLAESGCRVLAPVLIDRGHDLSVIAGGQRRSTVTHREMLYRAAYQMGRHLIGYEVQKVLAAVDWFRRTDATGRAAVGVVGYGEGALIALYAAALDPRVQVAGVSGYFTSRQDLWREPIDRNVFGLLAEFGDAELASLVAPRGLVIEACRGPSVVVPPGTDAAPGEIVTPPLSEVRAEVERARGLTVGPGAAAPIELVESGEGDGPFGSPAFVERVLARLGAAPAAAGEVPASEPRAFDQAGRQAGWPDAAARRARQFAEIAAYNQGLVESGPAVRAEFFAGMDRQAGEAAYVASLAPQREHFRQQIVGAFDRQRSAPNARTRLAYDDPAFRGYEVLLDVFGELVLYGILLVPKDLAAGERRPVVVCQHGLEGRAQHTVEGDSTSYRAFAARLARRGFVAFAPQHLYRGGDRFRTLQRKANPLGKSLFSLMVAQHEQLLAWLATLEFVDPERVAFYGISYGGKSAMRIPAVVEGYCLSICSSDFSNWIWRTVSNRFASGYLAHGEYEIFEFDLGSTFNYAEMAALICPRPFMVERLNDSPLVANLDSAEYGRVVLLYDSLGLKERTEISLFAAFQPPAPHGRRATFAFLHRHLAWPAPAGAED
jgi:dienelactone hydrolase